jgi:hypothetical protein
LWVVRAVNQGERHTPKHHRSKRPIRLTEADVARLVALKERVNGQDEELGDSESYLRRAR